MSKVETMVVTEAVEIAESQVRELSELQLALVGGGNGEVIFG